MTTAEQTEIVTLRMQLEMARNELLELRERNQKLNSQLQSALGDAYENIDTGLMPEDIDTLAELHGDELYTEGRIHRPTPLNFHD